MPRKLLGGDIGIRLAQRAVAGDLSGARGRLAGVEEVSRGTDALGASEVVVLAVDYPYQARASYSMATFLWDVPELHRLRVLAESPPARPARRQWSHFVR
jgi:hypothetical protein